MYREQENGHLQWPDHTQAHCPLSSYSTLIYILIENKYKYVHKKTDTRMLTPTLLIKSITKNNLNIYIYQQGDERENCGTLREIALSNKRNKLLIYTTIQISLKKYDWKKS